MLKSKTVPKYALANSREERGDEGQQQRDAGPKQLQGPLKDIYLPKAIAPTHAESRAQSCAGDRKYDQVWTPSGNATRYDRIVWVWRAAAVLALRHWRQPRSLHFCGGIAYSWA